MQRRFGRDDRRERRFGRRRRRRGRRRRLRRRHERHVRIGRRSSRPTRQQQWRRQDILVVHRRGGGRRQVVYRERVARETAVQLHSVDYHGHSSVAAQEANAQRHLRVHHVPVSVLPGQISGLAELDPAQPVVERLFHQNPPGTRQSGQGQLLDAGPDGRGHVRQR